MTAKAIPFIAGRDPSSEVSCGHSSYVRAHALAALRGGYSPHIFCVAPRAEIVETDFGIVHRIATPFRPFRQLMIPAFAGPLATAIERFLAGHQGPHLIHSFGVWGYAGILAAERLRSRGCEVKTLLASYTTYTDEFRAKIDGLAGAHGLLAQFRYGIQNQWARRVVEHYERRAYLESNLVTANYESVVKLIRERHGAAVKVRKVPYTSESAFSDEDLNAPFDSSAALSSQSSGQSPDQSFGQSSRQSSRQSSLQSMPGAISLLTIARNEPNKGIPVLLEALAELRRQGVQFSATLVGGGPLLDRHRQLIVSLKLGALVNMPGPAPDILPYLKKADVFVLPSLSEGSGSLALIEAMQAGLAIVASRVDGIVEDLVAGQDALLVQPGSTGELISALSSLADDPELCKRLAGSSRRRFLEKFPAGVFSNSIDQLYSGLLQQSVRRLARHAGS